MDPTLSAHATKFGVLDATERPILATISVWIARLDTMQWVGPYEHNFRDNETDLIGHLIAKGETVLIHDKHPIYWALRMGIQDQRYPIPATIQTTVPDEHGFKVRRRYIYSLHDDCTGIRGVLADKFTMADLEALVAGPAQVMEL